MGNINFGNQKENIQENAGSIFTGDMPQAKADSFAGAIPQPQGYAGGFFGTAGKQEEQAGSYVGGFVAQSKTANYDVEEFDEKKLPVKRGLWSRFKSFLFQEIDLTSEVKIELSSKEEKVLNEVHDFLFQELSFKGFMDILKIGNDKK